MGTDLQHDLWKVVIYNFKSLTCLDIKQDSGPISVNSPTCKVTCTLSSPSQSPYASPNPENYEKKSHPQNQYINLLCYRSTAISKCSIFVLAIDIKGGISSTIYY